MVVVVVMIEEEERKEDQEQRRDQDKVNGKEGKRKNHQEAAVCQALDIP